MCQESSQGMMGFNAGHAARSKWCSEETFRLQRVRNPREVRALTMCRSASGRGNGRFITAKTKKTKKKQKNEQQQQQKNPLPL